MGLFKWFKPGEIQLESGSHFGPYRLHELINSGGLAQLWLASNNKEESFALRIAHPDLTSVNRKRFIQGCEALSQIPAHPNMIQYIAHGKWERIPYLAMEYVEGANMRELFAAEDDILIEKIWDILFGCASALEHVHENGWLHLDYKPENIVISRGGHPKLIDFDLCVPKPDKPVELKPAGTPAYMAPEILLHKPADQRADIFAFGVIAYELFTHKRPFIGESSEEVLRKMLDERSGLVPPREYNPDISKGLEKVLLKCLERNPDKRYPHMSVVIRDLQQAP
ncbi:MAG: serine/threonine protein kinase [Verrucomicrobia bacterium]|jgi:serine/threonine protein kinase|nr:serine/threonine protein kinase [Verrucomicrobiota bacterium]MBO7391721.1 serine/threonine protein kinase [Verrucomicrobiota bacterium]MBP5760678.1 serine/threonine protein kinase [Verrucomicrobiota bacterium]